MAADSPRPRPAAIIFILITVALDMPALGVMLPVLLKLVTQFEGGDIARAASIAGLFGFGWATMRLLFQPVVGPLLFTQIFAASVAAQAFAGWAHLLSAGLLSASLAASMIAGGKPHTALR